MPNLSIAPSAPLPTWRAPVVTPQAPLAGGPASAPATIPDPTTQAIDQVLATAGNLFSELWSALTGFLSSLTTPAAAGADPQSQTPPSSAPTAPSTPPPPPSPAATAVAKPDGVFLTQFVSSWNPDGPTTSNENCGPTSVAMAVRAFGKVPSGMDPHETLVNAVRQAATGNTDITQGTSCAELAKAAQDFGLTTSSLNPGDMAGLDSALASGKMVIASGDPIAYERALGLTGADYGNNARYDGSHYILVMGKSADGNYIVDDPLSRKGSLSLTPSLMATYFGAEWGGVVIGA